MNKLYSLLSALLMCSLAAAAQIVTTQPPILQTNSTGIVVTFHANEGNKALAGLTQSDAVYAHTGVITTASKNDSDWKHAPTWGVNSAKYKLTWVAQDTWQLNIGTIDSFYDLAAGEVVKKLAFVFRNADSSKEGKTATNGDIFVNVYPAGELAMDLNTSVPSILMSAEEQTFTVYTTINANISIDVNGTVAASVTNHTALQMSRSFTEAGDYKVTATATAGGKTVTKSVSFTVAGNSSQMTYPGGVPVMGPVANDNGTVTFCIAAPGKTNAILRGSWNNYAVDAAAVMNYQDYNGVRYFWTTVSGIDPTKNNIYFFNIDGTKNVGDPYARLVLDPYNDSYISQTVFPGRPSYPSSVVSGTPVAVYNPSLFDYSWQVTDFVRPDKDNLLVYELLLRDFTGTEGASSGNGTIAKALEKLDYLKNLGVNAIELLPIMEFNGNLSWGYNTNFYFAPDKAYGTPADYKKFIDECHARGMAVVLDIVFNQSDGLHPWYMMYPISENPFYNANAPHGYSVLNDWNQDYPLVQQQWKDALQYWLTEFNVDGFRFDLVKGLGNSNSYGATYHPATNTWTGVTDANTNRYNATRVARMKELHTAMKAVTPDAYFINENLAEAKEENEMAQDGELNWSNINNNSCEFAMGYNENGKSNLNGFYAPNYSRTWGSTVSYAESHDEERMAYKQSKWGAAGVKGNLAVSMRRLGSVAAQMLMAPGAHMIWQFQEFGADQTTKNASGGNNTDNKKVIWNYLNEPERKGLMDNYSQLLWNRRLNPEFFQEGVSTSIQCSAATSCRSITLTHNGKMLYLVVNPTVSETLTATTSVNLGSADYQLLSCSYGTEPQASASGVTLEPGAYALYGSKGLNGADDVTIAPEAANLIYGVEGAIVVEGPDAANARAYTLSGTSVPLRGLAPGLYIVRAGATVTKVAVY